MLPRPRRLASSQSYRRRMPSATPTCGRQPVVRPNLAVSDTYQRWSPTRQSPNSTRGAAPCNAAICAISSSRLTVLSGPPPILKAWPAISGRYCSASSSARDEIVDEQQVAHLLAVAVDRDRPSLHRADQEMRDPALVLGAVLVRPVDAAHAEHGGRETEAAGVIEHVLVGGAFRTAVGAVELQRPVSAMPVAGERAWPARSGSRVPRDRCRRSRRRPCSSR